MEQNEQNQGQMQINIQPEVAKGVYTNFAIISHTKTEFVVDLAAALPGLPQIDVVSRAILAPEHAKHLMLALQENVIRYEKEFGTIELPQPQQQPQGPRTADPFSANNGEA